MSGDVLRLACAVLCILGTGAVPWIKKSRFWLGPENLERPFYIDCVSSSECPLNQCCTIGRERFSLPRCSAEPTPGQPCIPGAAAQRMNLTYPDGATVGFFGVFFQSCPCSFDSYCHPQTGTCVKKEEYAYHDNLLDTRMGAVDYT